MTVKIDFISGVESTTLPEAGGDPVTSFDLISKKYADKTYTRGLTDVSALKAVSERTAHQTVFIKSLNAFFYFDSASVATGDDIQVITPTAGTGRWLRASDSGAPNQVQIFDGSGKPTSEAYLAKSRGGSGQDNTSLTYPASGTLATTANITTAVTTHSTSTTGVHGVTGSVVGTTDTQTLTNKTLAAGSNTITGLTNANASGSAGFTNANLASMATGTVKGNVSGSTATPSDLTATQVTALLNPVVGDSGSGGSKGLVPAPASGDAAAAKFLKADGTWSTTPSLANPMNSPADMIYGGVAGAPTRLANGTSGQVLTSSGGTSAPVWQTPASSPLVASATPSAASSTTISGLDGNTHKVYKIVIRGAWSGGDASVISFRPNNDSTLNNYYGVRYFHYSGPTVAAIQSRDQCEVVRKGYGGVNYINSEIVLSAETVTGRQRTYFSQTGWIVGQPDGGYQFTGGGWNNTTSNITSLVFNYGAGCTFTGTINIYIGNV